MRRGMNWQRFFSVFLRVGDFGLGCIRGEVGGKAPDQNQRKSIDLSR